MVSSIRTSGVKVPVIFSRLQKLVEMTYDLSAVGTDSDAIFLEKVIEQEKDSELKEAFEDLDDYLFNW